MIKMILTFNNKFLVFNNLSEETYRQHIATLEQCIDKKQNRVTMEINGLPMILCLDTLNTVTYEEM